MAYAGALITAFYSAFDRLDWAAAATLMTADVEWHLHTDDGEMAAAGREETVAALGAILGSVESVSITVHAVHDEGTAAAVFVSAAMTTAGATTTTEWLDSFRFADGLVSRYVSLQVG